VAYLGLWSTTACPPVESGSDADRARWWAIDDLPRLAFDHGRILSVALRRLGSELDCGLLECWPHPVLKDDLSLRDLRTACQALARRLNDGY